MTDKHLIQQAAEDLSNNVDNAVMQFRATTGLLVTELKLDIDVTDGGDSRRSASTVDTMTLSARNDDMKIKVTV